MDHQANIRDIAYRLDHGGKYRALELARDRGDMEALRVALVQVYGLEHIASRIYRELINADNSS